MSESTEFSGDKLAQVPTNRSSIFDVQHDDHHPISLQPDQADLEALSRYSTRGFGEDDIEKYQVSFDDGEDDIENIKPKLSHLRKWLICIILSISSVIVTMLSSVWAMASPHIIKHFNISEEVSILGISFYIWGLGFGPVVLSPISELYGRRPIYTYGSVFFFAFQFLVAFSPNYGSIIFGRFLTGFFGSAFLTVSGGTMTDIFDKHNIGVPMCLLGLAPFAGPSLGPVYSAFVNAAMYWRWTFHFLLIASGVLMVIVFISLPETYVPVLLIRKAERKRKETGDDKYYAVLENMRKEKPFVQTIGLGIAKPFLLLIKDRMMFILCFYTGLALAMVYLFFVAFPYIFRTVFDFKSTFQGLSFLGLFVGLIMGGLTSPYFQNLYNKRVQSTGKSNPEFRLIPLMLGAFFCPTGLFIFAWVSYSKLHWIGAIIGTGVFGCGVALLFQGIFNYTVDAYRLFSASAMAANAMMRSTLAGIFPLFGLQMYKGIGPHWGSSVLAFIMLAMIPFPFLFYKYGSSLRAKSPYGWSMDD